MPSNQADEMNIKGNTGNTNRFDEICHELGRLDSGWWSGGKILDLIISHDSAK
ncbi:hypothetical protein SLEP1_g5817 [Rubroshorea leprosula]|uniref:Uncharacterized protein n=1 Tax=Rubroshorea leprosula TaxID=152421 RepID=A0AAV5HXJ1_9ROSI|nr:hypothetical protein SLEP1_g5817 [Rubroshorea leprosula]